MKQRIVFVMILSFIFFGLGACSKTADEETSNADSPMANKGIGPITSMTLGTLDPQKAAAGQKIFESKCSACHKISEKYVGPSLGGVTRRRSSEWILNMILNPEEMTQKDPVAKELLATHYTQMTFQNVTQDEAKEILEFFRQNDSKGDL